MTNKELNRDIKRLYTAIENSELERDAFYEWLETYAKKEFKRLHGADREFTAITKDNLVRLMIINRRWNFISHYTFALYAKI